MNCETWWYVNFVLRSTSAPECVFCLALDVGVITEMQWCPSGTHDSGTYDSDTHDSDTHDSDTHDSDTHDSSTQDSDSYGSQSSTTPAKRLGLLALACTSGDIEIVW